MIDPAHVEALLKFIGIQQKLWKVAVERSVLASVRAFHYLYKVRFGGLSSAVRPDLDPSNSDNEQDGSKDDAVAKKKSRRSHTNLARDYTDSDSSESFSRAENRPPKRLPPKALRTQSAREAIAGAVGVQSANASPDSAGLTPHPNQSRKDPTLPQAAAKSKSKRKCSNKGRSIATRPTASATQENVQTSSVDTRSIASRKRPQRKRWERIKHISIFLLYQMYFQI
jgi:hypothetical protein